MSGSFVSATSVQGALAALSNGGRVVAGGTDLVVGTRQGKWTIPQDLVAIDRIAELRGIRATADGGLWIGALATHQEVADHPVIREKYTALADASSIVGSPATRHIGTLGGNLVNASPAAETTGPLIVAGALAVLTSATGERRVPVADLATGPGRTVARPDELLTGIELPSLPGGTVGSCYARLEYRRQMEIAVVGATALVAFESGRVATALVTITALAPTVRRVEAAERALVGSDGGRAAAETAAKAAADASRPIDDVRAPAAYRRAMAAVITRRVIEAAVARSRGESVSIPASAALHGAN